MLQTFTRLFSTKTEKERIEEYLADSASLEDLEIRIRSIDRGQAPWQVQARAWSQGWAL